MRRFVSLVLMSWFVVLLSACAGEEEGGGDNGSNTEDYTEAMNLSDSIIDVWIGGTDIVVNRDGSVAIDSDGLVSTGAYGRLVIDAPNGTVIEFMGSQLWINYEFEITLDNAFIANLDTPNFKQNGVSVDLDPDGSGMYVVSINENGGVYGGELGQQFVIKDVVSLLEWTNPLVLLHSYDDGMDGTYTETQPVAITRDKAIQHCADLNLEGKNDWRLPNANEVNDAFVSGTLPATEIVWDGADLALTNTEATNVNFTGISTHLSDDPWKELSGASFLGGDDFSGGYYVWKTPYAYFDVGDVNYGYGIVAGGQEPTHQEGTSGVICVRGVHAQLHSAASAGKWQDVVLAGYSQRPVTVTINENTYSGEITILGNDEIKFTGVAWNDSCGIPGDCITAVQLENATLIRSGINDVKLKGEFKAFVNENVSLAKAKMNNLTAAIPGVVGIGDMDVIVGGAAYYLFRPATAQNPAGTTELATDGSGKLIVYCAVGDDGRLILDDVSPVTTPTGSTDVNVTDHEGNEATFTVEIIGEDTDVGVLNVPEAAIPYNFKSTIDHGRDYIYYGYNDGETALSYSKELSICNIGTMDISGTTFTIDVAAEDTSLVRSFSHDYSGSATGFGAGACQTYTLSMAFNRPAQDDEVKINITITDNFNQTTWDDYTTFKLSQYTPLPLYFAADTNTLDPFFSNGLQGLLVAPGRQLLRVNFTSFDSNNFIRVPRKLDDEYQVILATTNINDESTYMISTDQEPDITLMSAFTDVTINEPDNSYDQATVVPLLNGEAIGYLHKGDVDFYRLTETP